VFDRLEKLMEQRRRSIPVEQVVEQEKKKLPASLAVSPPAVHY
jgi:hypothetical protein